MLKNTHSGLSLLLRFSAISLCFAGIFIHGVARIWYRGVQAEVYRVGFRILFLFDIVDVFNVIESESALDSDSLMYRREDLFVSLLDS